MAAVTSQVEGRVPTALLRNIQPRVVAREAKIFFAFASNRFQKLVFVVRTMRIVATDAITNGRTVYAPLDLAGILVGMTLKTQFSGCYGHQLDASHVGSHPNFVATGAADGDRRVHRFSLGFCCMALKTLGVIDLWTERRMRVRKGGRRQPRKGHQ